MCGISWGDLEWGNVPVAAGALLTGLSFALAARTYGKANDDKRRELASKFSAWIEKSDQGLTLVAKNNGDLPIYRLVIECEKVLTEPQSMAVFPPNHQEALAQRSHGGMFLRLENGEAYDPNVQPTVVFGDAAGNSWRRDGDGVLTKLPCRDHNQQWNQHKDRSMRIGPEDE